jgi:hypothetical protein
VAHELKQVQAASVRNTQGAVWALGISDGSMCPRLAAAACVRVLQQQHVPVSCSGSMCPCLAAVACARVLQQQHVPGAPTHLGSALQARESHRPVLLPRPRALAARARPCVGAQRSEERRAQRVQRRGLRLRKRSRMT